MVVVVVVAVFLFVGCTDMCLCAVMLMLCVVAQTVREFFVEPLKTHVLLVNMARTSRGECADRQIH